MRCLVTGVAGFVGSTLAERLLEDLKAALQQSTAFLLLLALICAAGCSSDVEVERETTTTDPTTQQTTTERERTAVAVEIGRGQTVLLTPSGESVNLPSDVDYVIVDGCVHVHEHVHIYAKNGRTEEIAIEVLRGLLDDRCEWCRCR